VANTVKQQAFQAFDSLTEREQGLIFELIKGLAANETATPDDIAAHSAAVEAYRRGEYVKHEDVNWS
jgi:FixJ family two-component response regulator